MGEISTEITDFERFILSRQGEILSPAIAPEDIEYYRELLRFGPEPAVYPYRRQSSGSFNKNLTDFEKNEDPRRLKWIQVGWDSLRFEQGSVFPDVTEWYIKVLKTGSYVLPPISYCHPQFEGITVIKDGTHRIVAMKQLRDRGILIPGLTTPDSLTSATTTNVPSVIPPLKEYGSLIFQAR